MSILGKLGDEISELAENEYADIDSSPMFDKIPIMRQAIQPLLASAVILTAQVGSYIQNPKRPVLIEKAEAVLPVIIAAEALLEAGLYTLLGYLGYTIVDNSIKSGPSKNIDFYYNQNTKQYDAFPAGVSPYKGGAIGSVSVHEMSNIKSNIDSNTDVNARTDTKTNTKNQCDDMKNRTYYTIVTKEYPNGAMFGLEVNDCFPNFKFYNSFGTEIGYVNSIKPLDPENMSHVVIVPMSYGIIPKTGKIMHTILHDYVQQKKHKQARISQAAGLTADGIIFWDKTRAAGNQRYHNGLVYYSPDSEKHLTKDEYEKKYSKAVAQSPFIHNPRTSNGWGGGR